MNRFLYLLLGFVEISVAAVLVVLGFQLPTRAEVERGFDRIETATRRTGKHVRLMREQVHDLRRPELFELAERLESETRTVTKTLRRQNLDFDTVRLLADALGNIGTGLDTLAKTLDPQAVGQLGQGLKEAASYLDERVAPAAARAAEHLEETTKSLRADAKQLSALLRETPPDLKAAKEIYDGLSRFSEGLQTMQKTMKPERLKTMKEGFSGLESSLTTGAEQVEKLAKYSYPVVKMEGVKPKVEQKQFWPEGERIAEGMRKAAKGAVAATEEIDQLATDLPKLRGSLEESVKVAEKTREALGRALKHQDKLEAVLKDMPAQTARLAESLPQLGADLANILRDTQRLREVATALREAQKGLDAAVARWPELRKTLNQTATVLQTMQSQLRHTLEHRHDYEAAMTETMSLAETFAALLPLYTTQLERQMEEQEAALEELGQSVDDVSEMVPVYGQTAARVSETGRWLAWLVAALIGVHGLVVAGRTVRRQPGIPT